jgi:hypothetical protein
MHTNLLVILLGFTFFFEKGTEEPSIRSKQKGHIS